MIRAFAAFVSLAGMAQADMPSPLFCITLERCETATDCQPHRHAPPFVLRRTEGEWMMHYGPRGGDIWIFMAPSPEMAQAEAPLGVQVVLLQAGQTPEGALVLHEHRLEDGTLSPAFFQHHCETSRDGAAP